LHEKHTTELHAYKYRKKQTTKEVIQRVRKKNYIDIVAVKLGLEHQLLLPKEIFLENQIEKFTFLGMHTVLCVRTNTRKTKQNRSSMFELTIVNAVD
jgi:hypothetical protein